MSLSNTNSVSSVMHSVVAARNLYRYIRYRDTERCTRCHQEILHSRVGREQSTPSLSANEDGIGEEDMVSHEDLS